MSLLRTVAGNTMFLSAARVFNPLTSVLLISAIARGKGAEGLGHYQLVLTIFYMAVSLGALGLARPITRALSMHRERASDFMTVLSVLGGFTALVATGIALAAIALAGYPAEVRDPAHIVFWAIAPSVLMLHYEAIFLAFHEARYVAGIAIAENVCKVAIGVGLLALGHGILALFVAITCLRFVAFAAYLILFAVKIAPIRLHFDWELVRELRRVGPVFTAGLVLDVVLGRIDILILSWLGTMSQVGYYTAGLRLIQIARYLPSSYVRAALPAMAETLSSAPDQCRKLFFGSAVWVGLYGAAATLGFALLAPYLIRLLYGDGFQVAEEVLRLMALIMIPGSIGFVVSSVLIASGLELLDLAAQLVSTVSLAVLCVLLIPNGGAHGAAFASVGSQLLFIVALVAMLRIGVSRNPALRNVVRIGSPANLSAPPRA